MARLSIGGFLIDRRELEDRARKELRSLSGYVARLIVGNLSK